MFVMYHKGNQTLAKRYREQKGFDSVSKCVSVGGEQRSENPQQVRKDRKE